MLIDNFPASNSNNLAHFILNLYAIIIPNSFFFLDCVFFVQLSSLDKNFLLFCFLAFSFSFECSHLRPELKFFASTNLAFPSAPPVTCFVKAEIDLLVLASNSALINGFGIGEVVFDPPADTFFGEGPSVPSMQFAVSESEWVGELLPKRL